MIEKRVSWFPSVAVYLAAGYFLQKFIVFKLSSKYHRTMEEDHSMYTSLLNLCFLPLQMFQSGYCCGDQDVNFRFSLNDPVFLRNVKSITVLSVFVSLLFIFLFTFLFSNLPSVFGLRPFTFWNTLAFASSMAASDSAFMIPLLRSFGCSPRILAILEGETIISEVISILMFRTVIELQITVVDGIHIIEGINYFLSFLVMSFGIGIGIGSVATLLFRTLYFDGKGVGILQVALFFSVPIMAYMLAEGLHVSSSIAIRVCGFMMSSYTQYNLNPDTYPFELSF